MPRQSSRLPSPLYYPLLLTLSLASSSLLYSLSAAWTSTPELAAVSTTLDSWQSVLGLVSWRAVELGIAWWAGLDGADIAALSVLGRGPVLFLLTSFYQIHPATALLSLSIDTLSTYVPFRLLRPLSAAHALPSTTSSITSTESSDVTTVAVTSKAVVAAPKPPNSDIIADLPIQALTAILASALYATVLYTALASSYLPVLLVTHFDDIPSVSAAYSATPISLLPLTLVLGLAARSFIFTPATAAAASNAGVTKPTFDPVTATLWSTILHNVWGYSAHTKVAIVRTAVLMFVVGVNTTLQTAITVRGVGWQGAVGYASVWVAGAAVVGGVLGVVGAV